MRMNNRAPGARFGRIAAESSHEDCAAGIPLAQVLGWRALGWTVLGWRAGLEGTGLEGTG